MMVHAALKTEHTRQAARVFVHTARDNYCCQPGAPAHLLRLQSSWVEVRLVRVLCDIARISRRYATTSKHIDVSSDTGFVRSAERHLGTYLQLENEQTPWISPAVSTPHWGLSREARGLSRQNELDGQRPTDVSGSPRSAQKALSGDGGRACSLPNKLAVKRFLAISSAPPIRRVPVQTVSPRAFEGC